MRIGQTLTEYTLIILAIAALALSAYQAYGRTVNVITQQVNAAISEA